MFGFVEGAGALAAATLPLVSGALSLGLYVYMRRQKPTEPAVLD
jgi:hypothetical protein